MIKRFIRYMLGRKDRMAQAAISRMERESREIEAQWEAASARLEAAHEARCSPAARATGAHNLKRFLEKEKRT